MKELTEMNSYRLYLLSHLDTGLSQTEKYHDDAKEYSLRMFECAEKMQGEIDRLRAEVERLTLNQKTAQEKIARIYTVFGHILHDHERGEEPLDLLIEACDLLELVEVKK
jgi:hypothetical protein